MANICNNKFYFSTNKDGRLWKDRLNKMLDGWDWEEGYSELYDDHYSVEGYIDSKWRFPDELWKEILPDIDKDSIKLNTDTIYFRCLSEEYGLGLVSMAIYDSGYWWDLQTFNLGY